MNQVEDNPNSRFVDYTCVTGWELLIASIEGTLRGWKKFKSFSDIPNPQAVVDYDGTKLVLALFLRSPAHAGTIQEQDDEPDHEQHEITRWFGHRNFLMLSPEGIHRLENDGVFRAIFSALSIALGNLQFPLPAFMIMSKPARLHICPLVLGYAVPVPPRRHTIQFQSVMVQDVNPSHELYYLDGLFRHFDQQLQSLTGSLVEADKAQFLATAVEFYNVSRPYWTSVLRETKSEAEEESATHQDVIDGYLNDLWLYAPEISYSGSRDTLQELCVEIWFKGLKRGAVVDNEYYSTLLPSRAPPGAWKLRLKFDDSIAPSDSNYMSTLLRSLLALYIHAKAAKPTVLVSDFAEQLNIEQAQYIAAITSPRTRDQVLSIAHQSNDQNGGESITEMLARIFVEVAQPSRWSEEEPDFAVIRTSDVHEREADSRTAHEVDAWYRSRAGIVHDESESPDGLWHWLPNSAPVGRLLSVLAISAASLGNINSMIKLWHEFMREVRMHSEGAIPLPRLGVDNAVDRPGMSYGVTPSWFSPQFHEASAAEMPSELPNLNTSLLHQKLQMLQYCIHQRASPDSTEEQPMSPEEEPTMRFNSNQESEKVLTYLEAMVPIRWAGEMLCIAMGSLHFMAQDTCTRYRHIPQVQEALKNLGDQMIDTIAALNEDMKSAGIKSNQQEEAVCQRTLVLCDAVCESLAQLERVCNRLSSLSELFPGQWHLLGELASEERAVATTDEEVGKITEFLKRCRSQDSQTRELGQPSSKWFSLRCQARTTLIPVTSRDSQSLLPPVVHRMFAASDTSGFRVALRVAELE